MTTRPSVFDFAGVAQKLGIFNAETAGQIRESAATSPIDSRNAAQKKNAISSSLIKLQEAELVDSILQPYDSIPGFTLTDLLGRGGMGVVYKATQVALGRSVALKTILMEKVGAAAIGRFEKEARTLAKIQHPNIISVYDFGKQDEQFYFAMEFIDGEDVSDLVKRSGKLSETLAWGIIRQVVAGLAHAAKDGIVHRDIKPANVLLLDAPEGMRIPGGAPLAKVADFGLAIEERDLDGGSTRFTEERMIVGSPSYMSPEQFESTSVDFRSDIYSCGATVYEMLTGKKPFAGLSIAKLMAAKANGVMPFSIHKESVSECTKLLVAKMMSVEPADRFDNYEALLSAIDLCLGAGQGAHDSGETSAFDPNQDLAAIDADYELDDDTFAKAIEPTEQMLAKQNVKGRSRTAWFLSAMFGVVLAILVIWIGLEQFKYRPGIRDLVVIESLPLYEGENISGWPISQQSGQVGTETDELKSTALFVKNGYCRRLLPETNWQNYSLMLGIWIIDEAQAEIQFGVSNGKKLYGVLKLTSDEGTLLVRDASGKEDKKYSAKIALKANDYTVVTIEKQQTDWFLFINEKFFAAMPFVAEDDAMEIRLVAENGKVRFIELNQSKLGRKE